MAKINTSATIDTAKENEKQEDDKKTKQDKIDKQYPPVPPVDYPVNPETLMDTIESIFNTYCYLPGKYDSKVLSIWAGLSYVYDCFEYSPRIALTSALPGSGKSTVLKLLAEVSNKSKRFSGMSYAMMKSHIHNYKATMFLDEADTWLKDPNHEIYGMLNNGFEVGGIVANMHPIRTDEEQEYEIYAPVAIARNGRLTNRAFETRCISIRMQPQPKGNNLPQVRLTNPKFKTRIKTIQSEIVTVTNAIKPKFYGYPKLPDALNNRYRDIWEPMISLADNISQKWSEAIRNASIEYSKETEKQLGDHFLVQLLEDIKAIMDKHFLDTGDQFIKSTDLVEKLNSMVEKDYSTCWHGRSNLTPQRLGIYLKNFEIKSEQFTRKDDPAGRYTNNKYYFMKSFETVWEQYCPKVS